MSLPLKRDVSSYSRGANHCGWTDRRRSTRLPPHRIQSQAESVVYTASKGRGNYGLSSRVNVKRDSSVASLTQAVTGTESQAIPVSAVATSSYARIRKPTATGSSTIDVHRQSTPAPFVRSDISAAVSSPSKNSYGFSARMNKPTVYTAASSTAPFVRS